MTEDSDAPPRRLARSAEGRLITGVCAGLGRYTRIDPVVFRVGFALLVLTTGVGVLLYVGAFLLMAAPDGGPGKIEQWSRRGFDGDTVLALLGAGLAAGTLLGMIGHWGSGDALAVAVVFGLALFTARSRGVDLVEVVRGLPERAKGRPLSSWPPPAAPAPAGPGAAYGMPAGMVDLARLDDPRAPAGPPPAAREHTGQTAGPFGAAAPYPGPAGPAAPDAPRPHAPWQHTPWQHTPPGAGTATWPQPPKRRSYLTAITLSVALLVGAVLYAAGGAGRPDLDRVKIILAGALAVVAAGLFVGSWFGRVHKLITVGALMSLALASTSIAGDPAVARRTHAMNWRPATVAQAEHSHKVFIGEGTVDLTTLPLTPGRRVLVTAQVTLGVLAVRVPSTARVEIDGQAVLGDITVDRQVTSGPRARVRRVLEAEGTAKGAAAPIIELRLRSKVGDMEVTRVPA